LSTERMKAAPSTGLDDAGLTIQVPRMAGASGRWHSLQV
jgi:hypothetical protein